MHELGIVESILEVTLEHARGARVVAVQLLIGELSGYVDESIELFWSELTRGTRAEGAELRFRREAGTLRCLGCGVEFPLKTKDFLCPGCGGGQVLPAGGRECRVEAIDVEDEG